MRKKKILLLSSLMIFSVSSGDVFAKHVKHAKHHTKHTVRHHHYVKHTVVHHHTVRHYAHHHYVQHHAMVAVSSHQKQQQYQGITATPASFSFLHHSASINPQVYKLALTAYSNARQHGIGKKPYLTIIDYSMPDTQKRLWVIDMRSQKIVYNTLVAHGKNSGGSIYASHFSNHEGSKASSIGLYETKNTYFGHKGYSLRLNGLDKGFNDHALSRAIVMHGASYVGSYGAYTHVGHSWGCPSLPPSMVKPVINTIKEGSLIFAYGNDRHWLSSSKFLRA
jgi:hypothetical protein